jgi:hypothetical protein
MDIALSNVIKERNNFYNLALNNKIGDQIITIDRANNFIKALEKFINLLNPTTDYELFIKTNLEEFKKLKEILVGNTTFSDKYHIEIVNKFKRLYNQIIGYMKYKQIIEDKEYLITDIFTKFTQGITYFKPELQYLRWPIYHRNASCGSNKVKSIYKFKKTLFGPDKSNQLERCFIERIIYDKLYNKILSVQNFGHSFELQTIKRLFHDNIKYNIEIEIEYSNLYPIKLTLLYYDIYNTKNIDCIIKKEYIKTLDNTNNYEDIIRCYKKDNCNNTEYSKLQTFNSYVTWTQI